MTNKNTKVAELFAAGCHLGHKKNRIHPKAKKYIYTMQNGVSVIDLNQTVDLLESAKKFVSDLAKDKKNLLIISTKKVGAEYIFGLCKTQGISYVTLKWPAGLLTNFPKIIKNAEKTKQLETERDTGEWNKFVKHEQVALQKKLYRLEKFYGGLKNLTKLPDAVFVIDIKKEKNAVKEAKELKIPVVAIADTNVDPNTVDYPIPANDDSQTSIEYIVKEIIEAYKPLKSDK